MLTTTPLSLLKPVERVASSTDNETVPIYNRLQQQQQQVLEEGECLWSGVYLQWKNKSKEGQHFFFK